MPSAQKDAHKVQMTASSEINEALLPAILSGEAGIVLVAHGSRVSASNNEISALAEKLRDRLRDSKRGKSSSHSGCSSLMSDTAPVVRFAFLELAQPSIDDAIDQCAATGVKHVHILPYFLAAGKHVVSDIPAIVNGAGARHPDLTLSLAPHVGASDLMLEMLVTLSLGNDNVLPGVS